jgi:Ca-activated chloride channel family protein
MGLATAVNRLKDSKAKSKIVILLTDGVNNAGFIEPETAADIAKQYGMYIQVLEVMEWLNRLCLEPMVNYFSNDESRN